jgi:hypothetical protein
VVEVVGVEVGVVGVVISRNLQYEDFQPGNACLFSPQPFSSRCPTRWVDQDMCSLLKSVLLKNISICVF